MNNQYQIRVHSGALRGQAFVISKPEFKIGRDASCDIILTESAVSRVHAVVYLQGVNTLVLVDNNSTNGTTINNVQVTSPVQISENDVIMLGGEVAMALEKVPSGIASDPFGAQAQNVANGAAAGAVSSSQVPQYRAPVEGATPKAADAGAVDSSSAQPIPQSNGDAGMHADQPFNGPSSSDPFAAQSSQSMNPNYSNYTQNPYGVVNHGDSNLQQYAQAGYPTPAQGGMSQQDPYGQASVGQSGYPGSQPQQAAQYPGQVPMSGYSNPQQQAFDMNNPYGNPMSQPNPYGQQQGFDPNNPYGNPMSQPNPYAQQQGFDPNNPYGNPMSQPNPYAQQQGFDPNNPYGNPMNQPNPYAQQQGQFSPYGQPQGAQFDPYGQKNPYAQQQNPYGGYPQQANNPYGQQQYPYGGYQDPAQGYGNYGQHEGDAAGAKKKKLFIILGILLAIIVIIIAVIVYVDSNYLWCDWFPFLWSAEACAMYAKP